MSMEVKSALPQMLLTDALEEIAAPALGVVCVMEASCSAAIAEDAMGTEIGRLSTNAKEFTRWVDAAGRWSSWAAERRTMVTRSCVSFTFGTGGLGTIMANAVFTRAQAWKECLLMLLSLGSRRFVNDMSGYITVLIFSFQD